MAEHKNIDVQDISNGVVTFIVPETGQTMKLPAAMDPAQADRMIDGHIRAYQAAQKPHPDDRTATEVLRDNAAAARSVMPSGLNIPGGILNMGSMVYQGLKTAGGNVLSGHPFAANPAASQMITSITDPLATLAEALSGRRGPVDQTPATPTREEFENAAKFAGANLTGTMLAGVLQAGVNRLPPIKVKSRANPVQQAAIDYADREGLPVDLATRTQNTGVKYARSTVDSMPLTSSRGDEFANAAQQAIQQKLAGSAGVNAETVGGRIQAALKSRIDALQQTANQAYDAVRNASIGAAQRVQIGTKNAGIVKGATGYPEVATQPVFKNVAGATDVSAAKQAAQSIINEVEKEIPMAQRDASPGLNALKQIAALDNVTDLATADSALSQLKGIVRQFSSDKFNDVPALRSRSQGIAASIIKPMSAAVDAAADALGVKAVLKVGREAVKEKWAVADALDALSEEPVRVVDSLTQNNDRAISALRTIKKYSRGSMSEIGQSVLEGILKRATVDGGFKADRAAATWNALGESTKAEIFGPAAADLKNLFEYAKMVNERVNPSGSARQAAWAATGAGLVTHPLATALTLLGADGLSRLLYNPASRTLVTQGLRLSIGPTANVAAGAALIGQAINGEKK